MSKFKTFWKNNIAKDSTDKLYQRLTDAEHDARYGETREIRDTARQTIKEMTAKINRLEDSE